MRVFVFMALGAIVATVIAFGCAIVLTNYTTARIEVIAQEDAAENRVLVLTTFGCECVLPMFEDDVTSFTDAGLHEQSITPSFADWSLLRKSGFRGRHVTLEQACGWPMNCLRWYWSQNLQGGLDLGGQREYLIGNAVESRITISWSPVGSRTIPLIPIWNRFLVNTLFYAGLLFLLNAGSRALRGVIRRRRGLCPACSYDLRRSVQEGCPECGWRREEAS